MALYVRLWENGKIDSVRRKPKDSSHFVWGEINIDSANLGKVVQIANAIINTAVSHVKEEGEGL